MQIGGWSISKENISPDPPAPKSLVMPQLFYNARPNFREKMKEPNFQAKI